MAHNKLYRNFIILQEDERGYSHSNDKALSGYAKVEAKGDKCKVSFYAQNLRQEDNYSMALICCKRDLKQLIDLGPLEINGVGKGDTSKEYYVNNIAGLGISYEKISGAAICKVKDNETEFIMHGFINGEDSTDNWRKFKVVKVDSKKYINKIDEGTKNKVASSLDISDKAITSKPNNVETKIIETSKLEGGLINRKKDEKENIETEVLDKNNSKVQDKLQNKIPENNQNITKTINALDEDRNKCKESKKCDKCDKDDNMGEIKKCDKHEMDENIGETISKLAKRLENYDGVIDLKINNIHEDVIIYGFIKDKKDCDCKWKKFKVEKKCRNESEDFSNIQDDSKRIEENFKLDKLSETDRSSRLDRLDIIDFDEYENDIQQAGMGNMSKAANMDQVGIENTDQIEMESVNQAGTGNIVQTDIENIDQTDTISTDQTAPVNMSQTITENTSKIESSTIDQPTSSQDFNINGEIGQYFEKLAEGFEPYKGSLDDINYCKLYKINVNSIEDLTDESNYNQYTLAYYPMLNYYPYISKERYFLLGYKCNGNGEMKYIVYAIPGSKEKSDQPYGGRTGFVTWTSDSKNGRGYWLMFYDFKNSSIVIPTK